MKCEVCQREMSAYLDGEVSGRLHADMSAHLQRCKECRQRYAEYLAIKRACSQMGEVELPKGFHEQVMAAVRERASSADGAAGRSSRLARAIFSFVPPCKAIKFAAAAAAAFILCFMGYTMLTSFGLGSPFSASRKMARLETESPAELAADSFLDEKSAPEQAAAPRARAPQDASMTGQSVATSFGGSGSGAPDAAFESFDRKIIRRASVELEIEKGRFQGAVQEIARLAETTGGYIEESSVWDLQGKPLTEESLMAGRLVIRVPESSFNQALETVKKLGRARGERVTGQDVTEEYIDVESRLGALRVHETRLLELLGQAKSVDDLLRVESELVRVRTDIEALTRRMRYLERMVSYSTLEVSLRETEDLGVSPAERLWRRVVEAFLKTLQAVAEMAAKLVVFAASAAPVIAIAAGAWYLYRLRKRP